MKSNGLFDGPQKRIEVSEYNVKMFEKDPVIKNLYDRYNKFFMWGSLLTFILYVGAFSSTLLIPQLMFGFAAVTMFFIQLLVCSKLERAMEIREALVNDRDNNPG
jgi:hypothetical protein